jgi:hypothetical protein
MDKTQKQQWRAAHVRAHLKWGKGVEVYFDLVKQRIIVSDDDCILESHEPGKLNDVAR